MLLEQDQARAFLPYPAVDVPGASVGPLVGLSFAVQDLFDVAGYPTSAGNPLILSRSGVKAVSATIVEALLAAGARFVGKTISDELAFSLNGKNAHFGTPVNGAAPDRVPGGSSSGSAAAVSNGMCDFAIGTDGGGSIRAPASHCGLFGLRPTVGRLPLAGAFELAPSFETCGLLARDAEPLSTLGDLFFGPAARACEPRLLVPTDFWSLLDAEVQETLDPARQWIEKIYGTGTRVPLALESPDAMYRNYRYLQGLEAWRQHGAFIERHAPPLGSGISERFAWAAQLPTTKEAAAQKFRQAFAARMDRLLGKVGVVVLPTMPDIAPLLSERESELVDYRRLASTLMSIANLAGLPQVTLPLARREHAPLGISLIGPAGSDRSLIAMAQRIASAH
jgi:amidase